jgi:hypothetical protein
MGEDMPGGPRVPGELEPRPGTAAFLASDRASALTRTVVSVSCGSVLD